MPAFIYYKDTTSYIDDKSKDMFERNYDNHSYSLTWIAL